MSKQVDWSSLILAQARSGLSIVEFCRRRGVNKQQFYYHRRAGGRFIAKPRAEDSFLPLVVQDKEERFIDFFVAVWFCEFPQGFPVQSLSGLSQQLRREDVSASFCSPVYCS